jgi:hypothetical protein
MKKKEQSIERLLLFKLLSIALIEIREEAYLIKNKRIYDLSNLLHNLPGQLHQIVIEDNPDYEDLYRQIMDRAKKGGFENLINQIKAQLE